jgi:hypothetical protein
LKIIIVFLFLSIENNIIIFVSVWVSLGKNLSLDKWIDVREEH